MFLSRSALKPGTMLSFLKEKRRSQQVHEINFLSDDAVIVMIWSLVIILNRSASDVINLLLMLCSPLFLFSSRFPLAFFIYSFGS
jgi:hypothetical protein